MLNIQEEELNIKHSNNFFRISRGRNLIRMKLDVIIPFGIEKYGKKRILNIELNKTDIDGLLEIEKTIERLLGFEEGIKSGIHRDKLLRTKLMKESKAIDNNHSCRTFYDLRRNQKAEITLEYRGVWHWKDSLDYTYGHTWITKELIYPEDF